ncbi:E3 ubiquitin-protein ligase RSL1 [Ziziphus jujuba]|uniref:RBR-type E3 ubiquitin transferase n=1 Tax=Ziziphus jujuba TaxID=326968 RepID=A0A6P3ZII6_ZIZJJ|nr:E3 ubiquitin-protein ligase RSL1 [Ziziphus jujuba]
MEVKAGGGGGSKSPKKPKLEKNVNLAIIDVEEDDHNLFRFKPIIEKGTNKFNAISVEHYSKYRDLHLANFIDLCHENLDDELQFLSFKPVNTQFGKKREKPFSNPSISETGQSSNSKINDPTFVCEICVEPKSANESFAIKGCTHSYCTDCVTKYVASKLQENIPRIGCPVSGCGGYLEPEYCRPILPPDVFDRWGITLCEAAIVGSRKFYCPYKDCSMMMIDDGKEVLMECECFNCRRLFCAQCKVPWHTGIVCSEFQKLNKNEREREDIMLMNLARNKHWRRCPNCKIYVERTDGCLFMQCRCGTAFCYNCGNIYTQKTYHYCTKCQR